MLKLNISLRTVTKNIERYYHSTLFSESFYYYYYSSRSKLLEILVSLYKTEDINAYCAESKANERILGLNKNIHEKLNCLKFKTLYF